MGGNAEMMKQLGINPKEINKRVSTLVDSKIKAEYPVMTNMVGQDINIAQGPSGMANPAARKDMLDEEDRLRAEVASASNPIHKQALQSQLAKLEKVTSKIIANNWGAEKRYGENWAKNHILTVPQVREMFPHYDENKIHGGFNLSSTVNLTLKSPREPGAQDFSGYLMAKEEKLKRQGKSWDDVLTAHPLR